MNWEPLLDVVNTIYVKDLVYQVDSSLDRWGVWVSVHNCPQLFLWTTDGL